MEVRKGERTATILRHFREQGIVRDEYVPLVYIKIARHGESIKAGIYEFSRAISAADVVEKLIRGDVILKTVTIREGLDRFAIGRIFVADGFGRAADWDKATADPELIRDLAPEAKTLEGYLFPDTYKLTPRTPVTKIVQIMINNFRKHFGSELPYITTGLDPAKHGWRKIAGMRHMLLDADPTIIYSLKLANRWYGNIHKVDLEIDSPYNTYRFPGLPPGPIANPGMASLLAAAAPAKTNFLYFVARHDGSHAFATNIAEHNRNVQMYQVQWYRDQKAAPSAPK